MTAWHPARAERPGRVPQVPGRRRALTLATLAFTVALVASLLGLVVPYL